MSKDNYLFLFSISPVQSFISQARKTKDLYAGSFLLSEFTRRQIKKFLELEKNTKIIFPNDTTSESLPNRFVAKVTTESDDTIQKLGKNLQKNFQKILDEEFDKLPAKIRQSTNRGIYLNQILNTFETYWAAVKLEDNYKDAYLRLEKIHVATKNIKRFKQTNEKGRKCSLCGERNAYFYGDYKLPAFIDKKFAKKISDSSSQFTKNEALCTVCAIKRFRKVSFPSIAEIALKGTLSEKNIQKMPYDAELFYDENLTEKYLEKNNIPKEKLSLKEKLSEIKETRDNILKSANLKPSDLPKYYALIMFDGDNMGKLLAGKYLKDRTQLEDFHKELSKALSENAKQAKTLVDKYGKTVYAGGDDFLGFVPIKNLMKTLKELRNEFKNSVNNKLTKMVNQEITMSAGITIAHYKIPLKTVLDWARAMEKEAKDSGRDAFAIAVLKHSGEIHKTIWKWFDEGKSNIERIDKILEKLTQNKFSTNFIHTLEEEFSSLNYEDNPYYSQQFETELKRLIAKSLITETQKEEERKDLHNLCYNFYIQADNQIHNYFSLMKIIDFIARHLGEQK